MHHYGSLLNINPSAYFFLFALPHLSHKGCWNIIWELKKMRMKETHCYLNEFLLLPRPPSKIAEILLSLLIPYCDDFMFLSTICHISSACKLFWSYVYKFYTLLLMALFNSWNFAYPCVFRCFASDLSRWLIDAN